MSTTRTAAGTSTGPAPLATPTPTPPGGRVQLALAVDDLEQSVAFYSALFGRGPAKRRPGYANFSLDAPALKLVLLEQPGRGGQVDHLGVEVPDSATVAAETARLREAGLVADEELGTTCCWATQDKAWVTAPDGERWEVYTVLADSSTATATTAAPAACC